MDNSAEVDTSHVANRRTVRLQTVDDLLAEVERVIAAAKAGQLRPLGNWSAAQVLWHIGKLVELSFDGFPWRYRRGLNSGAPGTARTCGKK